MALHLFVFLLVVCLLLALARLGRLDWFPLRPASSQGAAKRTMLPRRLQPRSPDDCPVCRLGPTALSAGVPAPVPVRRLSRGEKPAGSPPSASAPRASPARTPSASTLAALTCASMRLFGDGKHGRAELIQTFGGPACRTTFTARRDTPLYRLKTPSQQVAMVRITRLPEGLDPSAAERVFGYRQATITSLSDPCWTARPDPARALLPPSLAPTPPTGRTAHPAAPP